MFVWLGLPTAVARGRNPDIEKPKARELLMNKLALATLIRITPHAIPPTSFIAEAFGKVDAWFNYQLSNAKSKQGSQGSEICIAFRMEYLSVWG